MLEMLTSGGAVNKPPKTIFKQLQPSEFITGTALASLAGASAMGTAMPEIDTSPWLILREKTKVYAIPQKPLKHSWPYKASLNAGLMYGKNVTIQGGVWTVRAFSGLDNVTSEWMRIMNGLLSGGVLGNGQPVPIRWASLSYDDLGIGNLNTTNQGVATYITETYNNFQYYTRGIRNNLALRSNQNMDNVFTSNGWRPILEWVSGAQPWV